MGRKSSDPGKSNTGQLIADFMRDESLPKKRLQCWLSRSSWEWLDRGASQRGWTITKFLEVQIDFLRMISPARDNLHGWTPAEAKARAVLADRFGFVLAKVGDDRFAIRCGPETIKFSNKHASSFEDVLAFIAALETPRSGASQ